MWRWVQDMSHSAFECRLMPELPLELQNWALLPPAASVAFLFASFLSADQSLFGLLLANVHLTFWCTKTLLLKSLIGRVMRPCLALAQSMPTAASAMS